MLFNSLTFLIFAAVFFTVWPFAAPRKNLRWLCICRFAFFFYGWWAWRYLPLMIATALVDYVAGLGMVRFPHRKKAILVISMVSNLGVLCSYKYAGLFARTGNHILQLFGAGPTFPIIELMLPLGISFYTF